MSSSPASVALAFVAVEARQHHLPFPGLGSKGASLPYMANEIDVVTVHSPALATSMLSFAALAADGSLSCLPSIYGTLPI